MKRSVIAWLLVFSGYVAACGNDGAESPQRVILQAVSDTAPVLFDGSIWVTHDSTILALDPATREVSRTIELADGADGTLQVIGDALWVRWQFGLARIDTEVGAVAASSERSYQALALVAGRLFGTSDGRLYEIDPVSAADLGKVDLPVSDTGSDLEVLGEPLVTSGDLLWMTIGGSVNLQFVSYDARSGELGDGVRLDEAMTAGVATGDRIWLADRRGNSMAIDVGSGERVDVGAPLSGLVGDVILDSQGSLFAGLDGSLWLLDQPAQVVWQLDPVSGAVVASFSLEFRPSGMVVTDTQLWITNHYDDRITVLPRAALTPVE